MKKILFTALLVAALLTQMVTFSYAASEADYGVIIGETYEGEDNIDKTFPNLGWTQTSLYATHLDKVVALEGGNNVMKIIPNNNWDENRFVKEIADYGEGTYELSYRMNFGTKKMDLWECFAIKGYTLNEGDAKTEVEIYKFSSWSSNYYINFGSNQSNFAKSVIPDDTWVDCKIKLDTVENKGYFLMEYVDGSNGRVIVKKYSAAIPSVDGLSALSIYYDSNDNAYNNSEAVALDSIMLDDLKLVKTDLEHTVLLDDSFDYANADTALESASTWVKSENGYRHSPKIVKDTSKLGNVTSFKPSSALTFEDTVAITNNLVETGEGVYEIAYRVNVGNNNTFGYNVFDVYGYVYEDGAKVEKPLISINKNGSGYIFVTKDNNGANAGIDYDWLKGADKDNWHNQWIEVRYIVDTINNYASVDYVYTAPDGSSKSRSLAKYAIAEVEGLSKVYSRVATTKDTFDGNFMFDDFKVKKLRAWYDASTGKPVENLSEIQANEEGKKIARYVSHYYSGKPTDVYLALYSRDKLAAGIKHDTTVDAGTSNNKVYKIDFELPENLTGLTTGNVFKWQPDLTPITKPIAVPVN